MELKPGTPSSEGEENKAAQSRYTFGLLCKSFLSLGRTTLSFFVSFTALSVYLYYRLDVVPGAFFLFSGVFLLACAASAINQLQERKIDSTMKRTKTRPLPAMRMKPIHVASFGGIAGCAGISLLYFGTRPAAALIGGVALFIYNVMYTPLKTRTPFGLISGAIAGALPVFIGCMAAIGRIEAQAVYLAFFAFVWQVPHFLLLLLYHKDDYTRAGIPTLLSRISEDRLRLIVGIWILAACAVVTLFPIVGIVRGLPLTAALACLNAYMIYGLFKFVRGKEGFSSVQALYLYQGAVFAVLIVQRFVETRYI